MVLWGCWAQSLLQCPPSPAGSMMKMIRQDQWSSDATCKSPPGRILLQPNIQTLMCTARFKIDTRDGKHLQRSRAMAVG